MVTKISIRELIVILIFGVSVFPFGPSSYSHAAENSKPLNTVVDQTSITASILETEIQKRLYRVTEFAAISKIAEELGVSVFLFGGSAASFAHYVMMDLLREAGNERYIEAHFDYGFTNIYRSNQDLDLVVDGSAEQAADLQARLTKTYPHLSGNRPVWEVRLLRENIGDKFALLDNPDFANQHTDSNSVGMIEVSETGRVRDLKHWDSESTPFLEDVLRGRIRFYFSDKHQETPFFQSAHNPEILSVIRYFAKVAQYEAEPYEVDLDQLTEIVENTKVSDLSIYAKNKLLEFGEKALLNSPNIEMAWNLLETFGLRQLLMEVDGNQVGKIESLSWWLAKEPLRSADLGQDGKTAIELGIDIVSHETRSLKAFESIVKSPEGGPNVFISRESAVGEGAVHGDGFYTRIGRVGAVRSGITIRFHMNPLARQGIDFNLHNDYVVIKNKSALTVIRERIDLSPAEYIEMVLDNQLGDNDKGQRHRILTRLERQTFDGKITEHDRNTASRLLENMQGDESFITEKTLILGDWLHFPISAEFPEIISPLFKSFGNIREASVAILDAFGQDHWVKHHETIRDHFRNFIQPTGSSLHRTSVLNSIFTHIANQPAWIEHPGIIEDYLHQAEPYAYTAVMESVLSQPQWAHRSDWVDLVLEGLGEAPQMAKLFLTYVMSREHWRQHPKYSKWILYLVDQGYILGSQAPLFEVHEHLDILMSWFELPESTKFPKIFEVFLDASLKHQLYRDRLGALHGEHWSKHHEKFKIYLESRISPNTENFRISAKEFEWILGSILMKPGWREHPKLIEIFLDADIEAYAPVILQKVLSHKGWRDKDSWVERIVTYLDERGDKAPREVQSYFLTHILGNPLWSDHPNFIQWLIRFTGHPDYGDNFFAKSHSAKFPQLLAKYMDSTEGRRRSISIGDLFRNKHWAYHPDLVRRHIRADGDMENLFKAMSHQPLWFETAPDLLESVALAAGTQSMKTLLNSIPSAKWLDHVEFLKKLIPIMDTESVTALVEIIGAEERWARHPEIIMSLIRDSDGNPYFLVHLFTENSWVAENQEFWRSFLAKRNSRRLAIGKIFSKDFSPELMPILTEFVESEENQEQLVSEVFKNPIWAEQPELVRYMWDNGFVHDELAKLVFVQRPWSEHPELILEVLNSPMVLPETKKILMAQPFYEKLFQVTANGQFEPLAKNNESQKICPLE